MSGEKPDNSAIGLTPKQAEDVVKVITDKWDGQRGLRLDRGVLDELIKKYGPNATLGQVLKDLNDPKNKI